MGERPLGKQIDRIDNNKGYSLDNCRWVTRSENSRNRRSSVYLTHDGETLSLKDWAQKICVKYGTLKTRILRGWDIEAAIKAKEEVPGAHIEANTALKIK